MAISDLGWVEDGTNKIGRTDRIEMHNWVKQGGRAYVRDADGNTVYLVAKVSSWGNPFVQTISDGRPTDNLLYLQECR